MPGTQESTGPAQCCCRLETLVTTSFPEPPASCSRPLDFGEIQEAEGAWPGQAYERELQTGTPPASPPLSRPPSTRQPARRGRLILHKTGKGWPREGAGDARTPCPPDCRQEGTEAPARLPACQAPQAERRSDRDHSETGWLLPPRPLTSAPP